MPRIQLERHKDQKEIKEIRKESLGAPSGPCRVHAVGGVPSLLRYAGVPGMCLSARFVSVISKPLQTERASAEHFWTSRQHAVTSG